MLAHLAWSFGVCLAALLVLVGTTTNASFQRERRRAAAELENAATSGLASLVDGGAELVGFMIPLGSQPPLNQLDASSCDSGIVTLLSAVDQGHLHLFGANRTEICGVASPSLGTVHYEPGEWFERVLRTGTPYASKPYVDPSSGRLVTAVGVQVISPSGAQGVLIMVLNVDAWGLELPGDMPPATELLVMQSSRDKVVAAAGAAKSLAGKAVTGRMTTRLGHAGTSVTSPSGRTLLAVEASDPETGLVVVAGIPKTLALAAAEKQLRLTAGVGLLAVALVGFIGLLLHRRLARPVRRLTETVQAAGDGDEEAWAATEGPAEYSQLAKAFNLMLAERRARERYLRYRASHDVLTGLPNRAAMTAALAETLAAGPASVMFLDLDRFKLVNDTHGHAVGDQLLIALGRRLTSAAGPNRMVARFGGDEFVILDPSEPSEERALEVARELTVALESPFIVESLELFVTGSVGVAIATAESPPDEVIRDADTAMYRAKEQGRPGYAVFGPEMRQRSARRLELEQDLHGALERGELTVAYQPVYSINSGEVLGAEALLRWSHPLAGPISPAEFIPVAEETGLIMPIGEWVMLEGCRQAVRWRHEHGRAVPVSVNLAARQLNWPGLPAQVANCLAVTGAEPGDLVLEITEHGMLEDYETACRHIEAIRDMGVRISVDDFGTGWSSLSYLQELPVDELKIDRSFIATLGDRERSSAIIGALVDMAHGLGLEVVAEGVEVGAQLDELTRLGCDRAQGYLFARPAPAAALMIVFRPADAVA